MLRTTPHSILHFFTRTFLPILLLCAVMGAPVLAPAAESGAESPKAGVLLVAFGTSVP